MASSLVGRYENCPIDRKGPFPARILLSKTDTMDLSVKYGVLPIGQEIQIHNHQEHAQFEFYPSGRATLFLEGVGEKDIQPGSYMYAPKGVKHGIHSVREPLEIVSVFVPPLF